MNKTCDFICSAMCGGGLSYSIGYLWFLLGDINAANAIMMLAGLTWVFIAILVSLGAGIVWCARHVRISIV